MRTPKNDNSISETIIGSTGNPTTNYYANPALKVTTGGTKLNNLRVAHAEVGVFFYDFSAGNGNAVSHSQFVRCNKAIQFNGYGTIFQNFAARNLLITDCSTAFYGYSFSGGVEHLTLKQCNRLTDDYNGQTYGTTSSLALTNSILASVTNLYGARYSTISGDHNGFYNNSPTFGASQVTAPSNPFQTVGAGSAYLASGSNFRNAGASNINGALASELKKRTTYPPLEFTGSISTPTMWSQQAPRDTDAYDCGYHYDPLDYLINNVSLTSTLTVGNGTAVGVYGNYGINLNSGSALLVCEGTPLNQNRLTRYQTVQEQSALLGAAPAALVNVPAKYSPRPSMTLRFTDLPTFAGTGARTLFSVYAHRLNQVWLQDCALRGAIVSCPTDSIGAYYDAVTVALTNNLVERGSVTLEKYYYGTDVQLSVRLYNNLFWGGTLSLKYDTSAYGNPYWYARDNHFDNATVLTGGSGLGTYLVKSHNGYLNTTSLGGSSNVVLTSFAYATGPLGPWYQASTNLIDVGSVTNAALAGMFQYTTTTNQVKEGNARLDIGLHFLPVEPSDDGLVARWRLDEGSGYIANDSGPYGQHGVLVNSPTWTTGTLGGALSLSGSDQYVSVPSSSRMSFVSGDFTMSVWVSTLSGGTVLAKGGGGGAADTEYILHVNSQGFFFRGAWRPSSGLSVPQNGTWTHVAVVFTDSDDALKFYQGGSLVSSTTASGAYASDISKAFFLGTQGTGGYIDLAGKTDDIRIYNRALSATEIGWLAGKTWDSDGDGIPDYLEDGNGDGVQNGADGTRDTDGDGVIDREDSDRLNPKVGRLNVTIIQPPNGGTVN